MNDRSHFTFFFFFAKPFTSIHVQQHMVQFEPKFLCLNRIYITTTCLTCAPFSPIAHALATISVFLSKIEHSSLPLSAKTSSTVASPFTLITEVSNKERSEG